MFLSLSPPTDRNTIVARSPKPGLVRGLSRRLCSNINLGETVYNGAAADLNGLLVTDAAAYILQGTSRIRRRLGHGVKRCVCLV